MKRYVFESSRLGFRELKKEDYKHIYEMNSDPEVMKYFPEIMTVEQSNGYISKLLIINSHMVIESLQLNLKIPDNSLALLVWLK